MLQVTVKRPQKTPHQYQFCIEVTFPDKKTQSILIGIHNTNYVIPHHVFWDSYYPLMFITRNGGPLYGSPFQSARVSFEYDVSLHCAEFFIQRAQKFGLQIEVTSPLKEIGFDTETEGELLLFGGGKDSRLILGMLKETGSNPKVLSAKGGIYAGDIPNALTFSVHNFSMPNRIVPGLMLLPKIIYHGSGLGEVHITTPWQQYFDISSPISLHETTNLLTQVGLNIKFETPLVILPYNIIQKILAERYPKLYQFQNSTVRNQLNNKLVHVSLCKLYHHLDFEKDCDRQILYQGIQKFIDHVEPLKSNTWGFRDHYEIIGREIRALIYRLSTKGHLPSHDQVNKDWDEDWIDQIHLYAYPEVHPRFQKIFEQFCDYLDPTTSNLPIGLKRYLH